MSLVISSIAPIFLLIALGVILKAKAGFSDEFWQMVEKLTFNGLFPALLFVKIAESNVDWQTAVPIAGVTIAGIVLTACAPIPFRRLMKLTPEKFVAVYQGGFRPNSYVGIAVLFGVYGNDATGAMAITLLTTALMINFLGVVGHLFWLKNPGRTSGIRGVAVDCIKNPLILSCLLGAVFNITEWGLPPIIGPTVVLLSKAALPMGLMAVGAGLSLSAVRGDVVPVALSSALKLVVQPLLTLGICIQFGLTGYALLVPVIFAALPTSSTAYVVSRRMGSDPELMAAIITATHLVAIISLPAIILAIT